MPPSDTTAAPLVPILGRRRAFWLSGRSQLRLSLWGMALAVLLLVPLNLVLHVATVASSERVLLEAPDLADSLRARDRLQASLVLGGSVVLVLGVFVLGILESHRTAGAARRLERSAAEVGRGRFDSRITLRRGDVLRDLAARFNDMVRDLGQRQAADRQALERIADEIERLEPPEQARRLATRVRTVVAERSDPTD